MPKFPENPTSEIEARLPIDAFDEKERALAQAVAEVEDAVSRLHNRVTDTVPSYRAFTRYWREAEGLGIALAQKKMLRESNGYMPLLVDHSQ